VQTAQPGLGKPKDIEDAFDAEIAAFAAAAYPNVFRPPTIDDPRIDAYINGAYGENVLLNIRRKSLAFKAPDLYKIFAAYTNTTTKENELENTPDNKLGLDALIVKKLYIEKQPIGQLKNALASGDYKIVPDPKKPNVEKSITGALFPSEYGALVDKYAAQQAAAEEEYSNLKKSFLDSDKYYKVGLPTPNLKYGLIEDLSKGTVSWTTHPSVARILKTQGVRAKQLAQTAPAGYIGAAGPGSASTLGRMKNEALNFENNLFKEFQQSGATPFGDEVKRREKLKKSTTLPGK
jgi:hypothetical protein